MATLTTSVQSATPIQLLTSANVNSNAIANLDTTNSVFISDSPSGTAGAFELTAGSTISWDRYRALYAYVTGAPVKVIVLDNGGQFFNGVAVANALMSSGLATTIATAIDAKQGIIQVGQQTTAAPAGILLGVLDSSGMQSILITGRITTATPTVPIRLDVMFYSTLDQFGVVTATRAIYVLPNNTNFSWKVPAYGVGFYFTSDAGVTAADLRIFKSKEPIQISQADQQDHTFQLSPLITAHVGGWDVGYISVDCAASPGGADNTLPVGIATGTIQMTVGTVGTAGATVKVGIQRGASYYWLSPSIITSTTLIQDVTFIAPAYPLYLIWYTNGATYSTPQVTLVRTP